MPIVFKATGTLDINTNPPELSEEDGVSGAMTRCKNLRLGTHGKIVTRDGSTKLNSSTALSQNPTHIVEQGGYRFVFGASEIYRNEVIISSDDVKCATPEASPSGGEYVTNQSVTITCDTRGATIYYTLDGSTPNTDSNVYSSAVTVPAWSTLKAISKKTGYVDSDIMSELYTQGDGAFITETGWDNLITETDSNQLITEGTS